MTHWNIIASKAIVNQSLVEGYNLELEALVQVCHNPAVEKVKFTESTEGLN